jgi:hypothetical protein
VADPDSLAALPVVTAMARADAGWIGCEDMNYAPRNAYARRQGETDSFDTALTRPNRPGQPSGERWDSQNEEQTRRHLPRLSALFL